jgi:hypothetical protein
MFGRRILLSSPVSGGFIGSKASRSMDKHPQRSNLRPMGRIGRERSPISEKPIGAGTADSRAPTRLAKLTAGEAQAQKSPAEQRHPWTGCFSEPGPAQVRHALAITYRWNGPEGNQVPEHDTGENTGDPRQYFAAIGSNSDGPGTPINTEPRALHSQPRKTVEIAFFSTVNRRVVGSSPT